MISMIMQDVISQNVSELTLGTLLAAVVGAVGLIAGLGVLVWTWIQRGTEGRSVRSLDMALARRVDESARDKEFMGALERIIDAQNEKRRQELREVAEIVLRAAQWQPSEVVISVSELFEEVVDGEPIADKPDFNMNPDMSVPESGQ